MLICDVGRKEVLMLAYLEVVQGCSLGDKSRVRDRLARHIQSRKHT